MPYESDVMTYEEAANFLRVSQSTLRAWVSRGEVPYARVGRLVRFHRSSLNTWLAKKCKEKR